MCEERDRTESIFTAAVAFSNARERADYVGHVCGGNAQLRRNVEALLLAHDRSGHLLDRPSNVQAELTETYVPSEQPGTVIAGRYKLLEEIGEGGMGAVWVAEQTEPVRRKVAIKLIKAGMDSKSVLARFEAERQALAVMDHPNIAKVLDGGLTSTGRPYFVMEYVKGVPITEYCDAARLCMEDRLKLFVHVCHAIQHAHQKGIIHRDLKPSNILVAPYDDHPVPKVIDFGLAKAMHHSLTDRTLHTAHETVLGTPIYMSPEQAQLNNLDVDTRSDIYSLGVLLYELLTGSTPLDKQRAQKAAWDEIRRMIREEDPPRPSTRLSTSAQLPILAAGRQLEPERLTRLVRGDLDWIVMKALDKDRTRRYESANGLAKDIERYLHDEPVEACPPTLSYRLRKIIRKHKAFLASTAAFALLLIVSLALVTWKWRSERAARADAELARMEAISNAQKIVQDAEAMNAANAASDLGEVHTNYGKWTEAEAAHTHAIGLYPKHSLVWLRRGDLYGRLGLWELMASDYAKAFEIREPDAALHWYYHALLILSLNDVAGYRHVCARMSDRFGNSTQALAGYVLARACSLAPDAVRNFEQPIKLAERIPPTPNVNTRWVGLYILGATYNRAGRHDDAVRCLRKSLANTSNPSRALNFPVLAIALHRLGHAEAARQELSNARNKLDQWAQEASSDPERLVPVSWWYDWVEMQLYYREAHQLIEHAPPPDDPRLRVARGRAFATLGRTQLADREYEAAVAISPDDATIRLACFRHQLSQSRLTQAESELNKAVKLNPGDAQIYTDAFCAYADSSRIDQAIVAHDSAVAMQPEPCPVLGKELGYRAWALLKVGSFGAAETLIRKSLATRQKAYPDDWSTFSMQALLGRALLGQKKFSEAEPVLLAACEGLLERRLTIPSQASFLLPEAIEKLCQHYEAVNKPNEAAKWRTKWEKLKNTR